MLISNFIIFVNIQCLTQVICVLDYEHPASSYVQTDIKNEYKISNVFSEDVQKVDYCDNGSSIDDFPEDLFTSESNKLIYFATR